MFFKMKKFLFLLSAITFFATSAEAQIIENNPIKKSVLNIQQVPAQFSYDGQIQVWLEECDQSRDECVLIDEDLNEKKRFSIDGYASLYFMNLNQLYEADFGFYLCQTLFNTDEKYEYIVPVLNDKERTSGFQIVSEGTVLQTVNFPDGITTDADEFYPCIIKIGSKLYLATDEVTDSDYNYYELLYKIDSASSSVSMVRQNCIGKTKKVYNRGRFLITNKDGKIYTTDGVEVDCE